MINHDDEFEIENKPTLIRVIIWMYEQFDRNVSIQIKISFNFA